MVLILIEGPNPLRVNNEGFEWLLSRVICNFNRFVPYPQSLTNNLNVNTLVQGLIVGPTPNPDLSLLFKMILLSKNDFPVLYFPATAIIPIFSFIPESNSIAS